MVIDRPKALNALDTRAKQELATFWHDAATNDDVNVVLLRGAGVRAFCAGSDLKEIQAKGRAVDTSTLAYALPGAGWVFPKPVIAAIHGFCLGMGMSLALHCDVRYASDDATFALPEVRHGMLSAFSALKLPLMIPQPWAMELLLSGRTITAQEALAKGILNRVLPRERLFVEAEELAMEIAAHPTRAVQENKRLAMQVFERLRSDVLDSADLARRRVEADEAFKVGADRFAGRERA
ncbi:MAG TPA: enoyl-CoA hydratase/isomerase family protein [Chloroflexota bacterium]|nr:enoyl-CoA hydratase/isomerase family protein [Chloroflexota bacterium]